MKDAIIVGAGPAGLYTGLLLVMEGSDVIVLEEHEDVGLPTHCTVIVSGETNQLYKIPGEVVLNRPSSCLVVSPGGKVAELEDPGEEIAVLDRAAFDRALALNFMEAGGMIRTSSKLDRVCNGDLLVEVGTTHGERLRARALVLACGVTF